MLLPPLLLLCLVLGGSTAFPLVSHLDCKTGCRWQPPTLAAVTSIASNDENEDEAAPPLPPGRPTNRFIRWLFDDTMKLLNPRDMKLLQRQDQFGPVFKTNFLWQPMVFCSDQASIAALAQQEAAKGAVTAFFPPHHRQLHGPNSVVVSSGAQHARLRRLLQDSLSPTQMKQCEPLLHASLTQFFATLSETTTAAGDEEYIEMVPLLRRQFMSIVLQVVLGTTDVSSELVTDMEIWARGLLAPPLTFLPFTTAGKAMRARRRIVARLHALMDDEAEQPEGNSGGGGLLATMMMAQEEESDSGSGLSRDEIVDNLFTLVFAGADTTSSAAISVWKELSLNPALREQLAVATPAQLNHFVQSILEAYPPAPFNMRQVAAPDGLVLQLGPQPEQQYRVPPKWLVGYGFAAALHKAPPPQLGTENPTSPVVVESSLAFGKGRRRCPGRYLATLELQIFTRLLLQQQPQSSLWQLDPHQDLEPIYTPGYFPVDGFRVRAAH